MTNYISTIDNVKKRHEKSNVANQDGGEKQFCYVRVLVGAKNGGNF